MLQILIKTNFKGISQTWGTPYAAWTFETDIILNAMVYVTCALHPIIYFVLNPECRQGLVTMWKNLDCNQSSAEVNIY